MTNYGREVSCTTSLRTGRYVSGARLVAEAAYRRLTTPRGMLRGGEGAANYGLDLTELVGKGRPDSVAAALPARIRAELEKDERIEAVDVEVLVTKQGPATSFGITIEARTGAGPFVLQLRATDVTVELLGIQGEG